ncbi:hypothetical protein COCOBI_05-4000 [Coccomyxa sp. Obi]|nr:hypothetical protein COCOBI_05-4000 [Coccomyxa sp. Obi]
MVPLAYPNPLLGWQPEAAATALYSAILRKVEVRIARWSGFRLSLLGRAYVAKQLLASMVTYHATFIPVPSQLEKRLCTALHTFVAANRPVLGAQHGRQHRNPDQQLITSTFGSSGDSFPSRLFDTQRMQDPLRVRQYVYAYQKLQPHRLSQPDSLEYHEVMSEPLFFNRQVRDATGQPIALEAWARQGLVRVSDLRTLVHSPPPSVAALQPDIQLLLAALPEQWRMFVHGPPSAAQWLASPGTADCRVWSRSADGSYTCTHTASSSGALVPVPAGSAGPQQPLPATAQPVQCPLCICVRYDANRIHQLSTKGFRAAHRGASGRRVTRIEW